MKRLIALACIGASAGFAFAGQGEADALKTLLKALASQRDVKATLLQTRADASNTITVNVQIVPRRGISAQITKPLPFAGMVSFDNGTEWRNYDPQSDLLRIEPSPSRFALDIDFRRKLIEKNYSVSIEREAEIAGRKTHVVVMKAKLADVASRRLYIDQSNALILRYMVTHPDGTSVTTIDTLSVDLTSPIDLTKFSSLGEGASRVERAWGPIEIKRPADAARYADFEPELPSELPAGLAMQALHVVGSAQRSFVGVRLTDGMAVVTVYMWKPREGERPEDEPFKGKYDARATGGIRIKVVGDASEKVRSSLATIFANRNQGPMVVPGTEPTGNKVIDRHRAGGGKGPERPKLVIDNESSY
jgi:outer membrane lipoprotein-sorting protein